MTAVKSEYYLDEATGQRYVMNKLGGTKTSDDKDAGLVLDGDKKWRAKAQVTEKPVWYENSAIAIDAATITTHTLIGANATAVEIYCNGDASFEGIEIVLNAATPGDAWTEIGAASGTPSLAEFCPKDKITFLALGTVADSSLSLTTVSFGAVGSSVNDIRMRFL